MVEQRPIHVPDVEAVMDDEFPLAGREIPAARDEVGAGGAAAPGWVAVGAIYVRRSEVGAFTEQQIALLESFADQAVIAIENARLFRSLSSATAPSPRALEQQTATAEVLRVIASRPDHLTGAGRGGPAARLAVNREVRPILASTATSIDARVFADGAARGSDGGAGRVARRP